MVEENKPKMLYRYLGNSGLKVSVLGFGNWLNSHKEESYNVTRDCIKEMFEAGVNFFDTAEIYGNGVAEEVMGRAFKELEYRREDLVVSTKIMHCGSGPNDCMLQRKHIVEGLKNSLKRLQLDYVDVVFCHRPDYETPIEETCRAMHYLVESGLTFYWGTSEWTAARIEQAIAFCEANKLHKPIVEQPQYNMLVRDRFEKEYRDIFLSHGYGSTIWSPLASGLLAGKYNDGNIPESSRFSWDSDFIKGVFNRYLSPDTKDATIKKFQALGELAKELEVSQASLCIAWALANTDVSVAILGFSRVSQVAENLKAVALYEKWTPELDARVEAILENKPTPIMDFNANPWVPTKGRRAEALLKAGRDYPN